MAEQDFQLTQPFHSAQHERGGRDELFGLIPVDGAILWLGDQTQIPAGFLECDGNNGTDDLTANKVGGFTWIVRDR